MKAEILDKSAVVLGPGRVLVIGPYMRSPGRRSPRPRPDVSCRGRDAERGRVDPAATFHGVEHKTPCEIDCHKTRVPAPAQGLDPVLAARRREILSRK